MRKRNISGLVRKCKELWKSLVEIKDIIEEELTEDDVDTDEFPEDPLTSDEEAEVLDEEDSDGEDDEELSLDNVKELFESYIGIIITGFITYKEDVPDIEPKIRGMLVGGVEVRGKDIYLKLYKITGGHGGYIKISPTMGGEFSENGPKDDPSKSSRYRLMFFGEDHVEYADLNGQGKITFLAGYI